jgi:AcrR family transcriptional regulator
VGTKRVLTKEDWLKLAMEVLRTDGVGGVRVLSLARSLGVTRGSFYWHFRDRRDLLDHMLDWWDREMTDTVIGHAERVRGEGYKRILALAEFILREDKNRYDMAIRSWADGDRKVAAVLRRVMQKRLEYVSGLFRDAGFSPRQATARGHLLAIYVMSEKTIHIGESLQTRLRLLRRQVRTLTNLD